MFDNKHLKLKKEENNKKINNKISILRKGKFKEFNDNNESDEDNIENAVKNKLNDKNNIEKESILELNINQNVKKSNKKDNIKNNNNYKIENNDSENSEIENINFPKLSNQNEREKKLYKKYLKENSESESEKNDSNSSSEKEDENSESPKFIESSQRQNSNNNNLLTFSENNLNEQEKKNKISIINHIIELSKQKKLNKKNNEKNLEPNLPDDTDNPDDLDEYEKWKIRELKRIKKNFIEKQEKLNEKIEIERRRNLTDEQRQEENLKLGSDSTLKNFKSKIKYLQKYYHKGAFFQDEAINNSEHIYNRDFNLPTWEDSIERNGLPRILEKRRGNLFKKSQSKYTHLTAEDTTNFDRTFRIPENINNNILKKIGGYKKI